MSFAFGFLIAAYTRIFSGQSKKEELPKWQQLAIDRDHYIDAVREYRNLMQSTLREAKDAVDAFLKYKPL
jgi:ribosomal protein L7/L12